MPPTPLASFKRLFRGKNKPSAPDRTPPRMLDQGPLSGARVALDPNHRGVAAWRRGGAVLATLMGSNGAWDPAATTLDEGPGCGGPELAMNPGGKALCAWVRQGHGGSEIVVRWISQGFEGHNTFVTRVQGATDQLQLVLDRRGDAMLAWVVEHGGRFRVEAIGCSGRTGQWDRDPSILSGDLAHAPLLRLALGAKGDALAVWSQTGAPYEGLVACHYFSKERTWGDRPQSLLTGAISGLDFAMDDSGNGVALVVRMEEGRQVLDAMAYHAGHAAWHGPSRLAGAQELDQPRARMADGGAALATWRQSERTGTYRLFAKAMRGGKWEERPERLDTDLGAARAHALAMTSGGRAAALFCQTQGAQECVYLRTFQHGAWNPVLTQLNAPSPHPHHGLAVDRAQEASICLWMVGSPAHSGLLGSFGK